MKHSNVNYYRNGVMGVGFFVVLHEGQDDFADEQFFTVVFGDQVEQGTEGNEEYTGYSATFRLRDLNIETLPLEASIEDAISAWRPEWAFEKAKPLIADYLDILRGPGPVMYNCPRCSSLMEEVGLAKRLRCENEECSA